MVWIVCVIASLANFSPFEAEALFTPISFEDFNFSNLTDSGIAYIANEVSNSVACPGYSLVSSIELIKFSGIRSQ